MKKLSILFLLCLLVQVVPAQGSKALDLKEITSGKFRAEGIQGVIPMADGEHYTQMNAEGTQIIKYSFRTGQQVEVVFDVAKARECTFKRFDGYTFSPDGSKILIRTETQPIYRHSYKAVHYLYTIKRNIVEKLSEGGPQQSPVFSPDGNMVAFVRDNNIFLVKMLYGNSESQVTEDGKFNHVLNGIPDWVYEEEFSFATALEFSPDNTMLAFIRFDESEVASFTFPIFAGQAPHYSALETYPGAYTYKYPKAGEANSKVSVHTFDIKSKVTRKMKLPLDPDGYIPRIRFTQDAAKLAIMTLNRNQNRFDLYFADPRSTLCKLVLRDESPYYINESVFDNIMFYPQNFSFISEKDGYSHLYWYSMGGNLVKQVTKGKFEVKRFIGWDAATNTFYFESNEESPLRTAVYKTDKKGGRIKLSEKAGTNSAIFSSNLKYFMNTYSSLQTPAVITLNDNTGKVLKTLVTNQKLKETLAQYQLPKKEFFTFRTSQGTELNGWMIKPADFNESKKYPVLLYQYSGPGSQEVVDKWGIGGDRGGIGWDAYMASKGYVIVCVDGRGTGYRGTKYKKVTYKNLGKYEIEDQIAAAKWLGNQSYIDKSRIGIFGWSYGGYMASLAMTKGADVFKAGIAVAPVTNWRYYDSIYTERFLQTPQENPEGYDQNSPTTFAKLLKGKFLLIHGTADDNVHFQNSMEFSEALIQNNKQFEFMAYPDKNHGIYGGQTRPQLYKKMTDFILGNL